MKQIYMSDIAYIQKIILHKFAMIIDTVFSIFVASRASATGNWIGFCIEFDPKYLYISTLALCFLKLC